MPVYCCDYGAKTMRRALAAAVRGEALKKSDQLGESMAELGSNPTHTAVVGMIRSLNQKN
jgi:hypothetical protein